MDYTEIAFQMILHGGNARSSSMEAIACAKSGNIQEARKALECASKELSEAHRIQTRLIQEEAAGKKSEVTLLMVHAQDHLMNTITIRDLAAEFVDLYETFIHGRVKV
ncbi:PTS lactose/cellobiose transporter subunit IIA [Polycladomyces sp. WAk]|uniref:PTS lactose/cellobiose transporter subunit IIA n=1 Tax=Polycladomyces zharkentensis TaxID=2807616 RepID=A0ABS2WLB2_9BACL|nr:PTS lactose/cellobiose transporter subunit IIA [Polycladomyces sp. WAk]MBN2910306.1 PTS lactose/cellobiose transporter subunit IIA [Polycladomyces sp. WAk]